MDELPSKTELLHFVENAIKDNNKDIAHAQAVLRYNQQKSDDLITLRDMIPKLMDDSRRLDILESEINKEPLLMHDGNHTDRDYRGLGLRPGKLVRTLREAIDDLGDVVNKPI